MKLNEARLPGARRLAILTKQLEERPKPITIEEFQEKDWSLSDPADEEFQEKDWSLSDPADARRHSIYQTNRCREVFSSEPTALKHGARVWVSDHESSFHGLYGTLSQSGPLTGKLSEEPLLFYFPVCLDDGKVINFMSSQLEPDACNVHGERLSDYGLHPKDGWVLVKGDSYEVPWVPGTRVEVHLGARGPLANAVELVDEHDARRVLARNGEQLAHLADALWYRVGHLVGSEALQLKSDAKCMLALCHEGPCRYDILAWRYFASKSGADRKKHFNVDTLIGSGEVYRQAGFTEIEPDKTRWGYFWEKNGHVESRYNTTKTKLPDIWKPPAGSVTTVRFLPDLHQLDDVLTEVEDTGYNMAIEISTKWARCSRNVSRKNHAGKATAKHRRVEGQEQ